MDASRASDLHRTCESSGRHKINASDHAIGGLHVDSPRLMMKIRRLDHEPRSMCDRGPIIARSWPDCHAIVAYSLHNWSHNCCILMAHDHFVIVAINRPLSPRLMMKIRQLDHEPRSTCDRGPIIPRSWPIRRIIGATIAAD